MTLGDTNASAVILAGGFGTRIRSLLGDLPKPMAPVNGRPFVEWVIRYLTLQGIARIILSTGYRAEAIESHFAAPRLNGVRVECVRETSPMGTAGGFLNVIRQVADRPESWIVLNGDSLTLGPLAPLLDSLKDARCDGAILGVPMEDASRYGTIDCNENQDLVRFLEKKPGSGTINAGVYVFRESIIGTFPKQTPLSFESDVFPEIIRQQRHVRVCVESAAFLDIGTPESLGRAEAFISQNQQWFST